MMFYFQSICPCSKEILYIDTINKVYIYPHLECFFLKANRFAAKRHLKLETDNLTLHLTFLRILTKGMLLMGKMIIPTLRCKCPPFVVEQSSSPTYLGYLALFVTCHEFPISIRYYHKQLSYATLGNLFFKGPIRQSKLCAIRSTKASSDAATAFVRGGSGCCHCIMKVRM